MPFKLKPVSQQTIVITGASSGIGLETARRAAEQGARVFLIARNAEALERISGEIAAEGGQADWYAADMGVEAEAEAAAQAALSRFGGFDSWVNCAGVGLYQDLEDVSDADHRRVFDTNYFGVVHGSQAAIRHLKTKASSKGSGGALINVGSIVSDIAIPVLGAYAASKHAVKGFTDALRMELMDAPVSVTLIKPSSVDTPFAEHAKNTLERAARVVPPVYKPEAVADAILAACAHRHREITVGLGGRLMTLTAAWLPRISDRLFAATVRRGLQSRTEPAVAGDALHDSGGGGRTRGPHRGVVPVSPYTKYQTTKAGRVVATVITVATVALALKGYADRVQSLTATAKGMSHRRRRHGFGALALGRRH